MNEPAKHRAVAVEGDPGEPLFRSGWPERVEGIGAARQAGAASITTWLGEERRRRLSATRRALLGRLALGLGGQGLGGLLSDQQSAERMQVASQYPQRQIPLKADLGMVPAAFQTVAGLQRANGRFHARMPLSGLAELNRGGCFLLGCLFCAWFRKAGMLYDP